MQLSKADELFPIQSLLWCSLGLDAAATSPAQLQAAALPTCVAAARTICLQAAELQQLLSPEDIQRPLNPRNEAAALALLLSNAQSVCGASTDRQQQLQALLAAYPSNLLADNSQQQQSQETEKPVAPASFPAESPEQLLYMWALEQGAVSQLTPALFPASAPTATSSSNGGGCAANSSSSSTSASPVLRGCAAAADLPAGSVVMQVPLQLLITYQTAAESDFGRALSRLPGLDPETLAVLWTMVDRHEPESPHAPFWAALPPHFGTGLSVPQALVDVLRGLPLHAEVEQARAHVRQQFAALQQTIQVLLTAYPSYLQPGWFSEASYLWAVELWYAYAIQVKLPDSSIQPALVPLASLINHSAAPHIVHFSTVNPKSRALELRSFRPLRQHEQACLSYGPLPNSQLLLFYGFALPGNPFEQQQLTVQPEEALKLLQQQRQGQGQRQGTDKDLLAEKMQLLQELQLPAAFDLTVMQQPLPHELQHSLRLLCADRAELTAVQQAVRQCKQQQEGAGDVPGSSAAVHASSVSPAGNSSSSKGGKKKGKSKGLASSSNGSAGASTSSAASSVVDVQQRWAAVSMQRAVLGQPLSDSNEAAAVTVLGQLLAVARQPYEESVAKLQQRQQVQELLLPQLDPLMRQQLQKPLEVEAGFAGGLEVYLRDVLALFDACCCKAAAASR